jgi:hypothetical protein
MLNALSISRSPFGSQRHAFVTGPGGHLHPGGRSQASVTIAHRIRFCPKSCSGRSLSPVSIARRTRSSQRARRRCYSAKSARRPRPTFVANAVTRCPSVWARRRSALGWGDPRAVAWRRRKPVSSPFYSIVASGSANFSG